MAGLYIHIPFCVSKCSYCDFYSLAPGRRAEAALFVQCLETELGRLPDGFAPETVFVGGGTPTALAPEELERLFGILRARLELSRVGEFSVEANPGTLTPRKLDILRGGGANRMSIGVQSFNDDALRLLGRAHTAAQAREAVGMLRAAGFENINIDLIQSIPGTGTEDTLADVRAALALEPEHLSVYNLSFEEGTPLFEELARGRVEAAGDDAEAETYFAVRELLERSGFVHYEISNYCRSGRECRHNLLYWTGGEYFGCGPSAHSHWRGARWGNFPSLENYAKALQKGHRPGTEAERLAAEAKARETLVMGLRLVGGIELEAFRRRTGFDADALCGEALVHLEAEGLLLRANGRLRLAPKALFVSNAVFCELV